jgi:hypothetical protein
VFANRFIKQEFCLSFKALIWILIQNMSSTGTSGSALNKSAESADLISVVMSVPPKNLDIENSSSSLPLNLLAKCVSTCAAIDFIFEIVLEIQQDFSISRSAFHFHLAQCGYI